MPRARTVAIALSAAALALPAGALGQGASGAGDDQYADPFDNGSGTTTAQTKPGPQSSGGSSTSSDPGLSQNPDLGGGSTTPSSSGAAPAATGTTATGALPNTGSDPRLLILAGLALLLSGLGLRLRTADEVF